LYNNLYIVIHGAKVQKKIELYKKKQPIQQDRLHVFLFCSKYQRLIAPLGHASAHVPHSVHSSGLML